MTEIERLQAIISRQQEIINLLMQGGQPIPAALADIESASDPPPSEYAESFAEEEFKAYLIEKGLSDNSVDTYRRGMIIFFKRFKRLTPDTAKEYRQWLVEKNAPKTVNIRLCGLEHYAEFSGVSIKVKHLKEQKAFVNDRVISPEQYEQLSEYAKNLRDRRVYIIVRTLAQTGMRVSELITIKISDIQEGEKLIVSKADKVRTVFFTKTLLNEIRPFFDEQSEWLVPSKMTSGRTHITSRNVSDLLKEAAKGAKVDKSVVYPHSFRHFFAKEWIKNGGDLATLADLLGHSDLSTTAIYTRKSKTEQKAALEDFINW